MTDDQLYELSLLQRMVEIQDKLLKVATKERKDILRRIYRRMDYWKDHYSAYYQDNKDHYREVHKEYKQTHKDVVHRYNQKYYKAHKKQIIAQHKAARKRKRKRALNA